GAPHTVGLTTPVQPGEWVTLWGTGLGSANANSVSVEVAGISAAPSYAGPAPGLPGVDQINFQFPAGVPDDCYVPVTVKAADHAGNTASVAAASAPGVCHHRLSLSPDALARLDQGGRVPLSQSWGMATSFRISTAVTGATIPSVWTSCSTMPSVCRGLLVCGALRSLAAS